MGLWPVTYPVTYLPFNVLLFIKDIEVLNGRKNTFGPYENEYR